MTGAAGGFGLAWRLARRELRGGIRGFGVFLGCLALGVAAIAAVGVVNAGFLAGLKRDAASLLGGDLKIDVSNLPVEAAELANFVPPGARRSDVIRTNAIAYGADGRHVVVGLKAVDGAYPLYGEVVLDPPIGIAAALADRGAVVERGLLNRLDLVLGDPVRIGAVEFELRAVVEREPDRVGGFVSIGPRVLVQLDDLAATETILPGSLARYSYRFAMPPGVDANATLDRIRADHPDARWRVRGARDVEPQVSRFIDRLASYLTLAGLTSLLIGGVGVALAIQNYLSGKTATIATLKCVGASSGLIFRIYMLQVLALASIGVALGLVIGQTAPWIVTVLAAAILPVEVATGFYPVPLLIAAACGLLTALGFAVWPLARARETSPAGMFRTLVEPGTLTRRPGMLVVLGLCLGSLALLAVFGVADRRLGAIFVAVAIVTAVLLVGCGAILRRGVAVLGRHAGTRTRLALANLHRPGSDAQNVIVALGAGLAVLTMVVLLQYNLAREVEMQLPARAPSAFFIDVQRDQLAEFEAVVAEVEGATVLQSVPVIRGRVIRIKDVPVHETGISHWTLRRDRGLSYASTQPEGSVVTGGSWWPADYSGPALVSVEDEVAEAYGVGIGDRLSFNILGRVVDAEIASIREEIDWSRGRLDFVFMFSPGVLDAAPHTLAAAVEVPPAAEPALLDLMAERLPNVTPISVREVVARVGEVLGKIELAVGAVAGVTILSGVLVLAGAVAAARRRHRYEAVVLKVLGARRMDLVRVFLIEYLGLGLTAAIVGGVLGTLGAAVVVLGVFGMSWSFSLVAVIEVLALALAITLLAGFVGTWRLLGRPAAEMLRAP